MRGRFVGHRVIEGKFKVAIPLVFEEFVDVALLIRHGVQDDGKCIVEGVVAARLDDCAGLSEGLEPYTSVRLQSITSDA